MHTTVFLSAQIAKYYEPSFVFTSRVGAGALTWEDSRLHIEPSQLLISCNSTPSAGPLDVLWLHGGELRSPLLLPEVFTAPFLSEVMVEFYTWLSELGICQI